MPKFRVLRGRHTQGKHPNGDLIIYYGPRIIREKGKEDKHIPGDVVDSRANLMVLNKQASIKFEPVDANTPVTHNSGQLLNPITTKASALAVEEVESDGLEELTVTKLKDLAAEEEIELDIGMKKDEIINSIRIARDLS